MIFGRKTKIVIVDSHNEVLPHWVEEFLRLKLPLVVVRIDKHHDMNQECPALPAREGRQLFDHLAKLGPRLSEYTRGKNSAKETLHALHFHYGINWGSVSFSVLEEIKLMPMEESREKK